MYQALKDHNPDVQVFVELKPDSIDLVEAFKRVTQEEEMEDRISSIMFGVTNLKIMKREYPQMSIGYLSSPAISGYTGANQTRGVLRQIQAYGSTYNPSYDYHSPDFFANANMRGITSWPWTINGEPLVEYFLAGANGLTTDTSQVLGDFTKFLRTEKKTYKVGVGSKLTIDLVRESYDRKKIDANEDARLITFKGEGQVLCAFEYKHEISQLESYSVYSELVTINIEGQAASNKTIIIVSLIATILLATVIVIVFIKRKRS